MLADALRESGLPELTSDMFNVGMLLVGAMILVPGVEGTLTRRRSRLRARHAAVTEVAAPCLTPQLKAGGPPNRAAVQAVPMPNPSRVDAESSDLKARHRK